MTGRSDASTRRAESSEATVTGTHRAKFFRRPNRPSSSGGRPTPAAHAFVPAPPAVPRDGDARPSSRGANLARAAADAASASDVHLAADAPFAPPRSRTLGTQSDYRESEAQTVPYEPDFFVPERPSTRQAALNAEHHVDGDAPELLTLRHLRFGDGVPVGDAEATLVQRMRAKRAFEASLPPLSDVARLPLRQRLMEEWEEAEWAEREREIAKLQEERLDVLKRAIDAREAEAEALAESRLKRMRAGMLADKHRKFASIQTKRVKHLRKLAARRDRDREPGEGRRGASSAVDEYADYASTVYAPLSREGGAPRDGPPAYAPDPRRFESGSGYGTTLGEFAALEASIPRDATDADAVVAAAAARDETRKKRPEERREAAANALLDATARDLDAAKRAAGGERGVGSCWPAPTDGKTASSRRGGGGGGSATASRSASDVAPESTSKFSKSPGQSGARVERPETPKLAPPMGGRENASAFAAVVTLQRLLRGVASGRATREGAARRGELTAELLEHGAETKTKTETETETTSDGTLAAEAGAAMATLLRALSARDAANRAAAWAATDLATRYAEEERLAGAAAKIQAQQRGRRARIEARRRRAELERSGGLPDLDAFDEEETARVVRIQAQIRGRRSRRETSFVRNPELRPRPSPKPKPASTETESIAIESTETTVSLAGASAKDRADAETLQASARAHVVRVAAEAVSSRIADASAEDRTGVETLQMSARSHVARVAAADEAIARAGESDRAAVVTLQTSARAHVACRGGTGRGTPGDGTGLGIELGIEPATVASVADRSAVSVDAVDASRWSDADAAKVAKMQASARRHLDETHQDPVPAEAMPDLDDAGVANVEKMQASARALLERRQAERRAAKAEEREREATRRSEEVAEPSSADPSSVVSASVSAPAPVATADSIDVGSLASETRDALETMQASARAHLSRMAPVDLSSFSEEDRERVIKIQAAARGRAVRRARGAGPVPALGGGGGPKRRRASTRKASTFVAAERDALGDFTADDEAHVVKIQAATRGHLARRRVARDRKDGTSAEGTQGTSAPETETGGASSALAARRARRSEGESRGRKVVILDADVAAAAEAFPGTPAEQAAAAKIQAAYRGGARRRQRARESEADVEARRLKEEAEAEAAAIKIQASYRGTVSRRSVASMRAKARLAEEGMATSAEGEALDAAATKIQAVARGRAARQRVAELRDGRG